MMRFRFPYRPGAFLFLIACCALLCSHPARAEDTLDVVERGLGLLSSGDTQAARQALAPVIGLESSAPMALAARGTLELLEGKSGVAEMTFRRALEDNPRQLAALWGLSLSLLVRNRVFEATAMIDRAALVAPDDPRVKTLQAYVYTLLGRYADATQAGKEALEAGDQSPFLMAVLAQVHYNLGYTAKALLFGQRASELYNGMDFLNQDKPLRLPLTMIITDTPDVLTSLPARAVAVPDSIDLPLPKVEQPAERKAPFQVVAPRAGSTVHGLQRIQAAYRGNREIKFVVFLVDQVMRGMTTELPYHFMWDADAAPASEHQLTVRAYDYRGVAIEEDTITVIGRNGEAQPPQPASDREIWLQQRIMNLTLPTPAPLSLFTQMGAWYRERGETAKATAAFEKAAALDARVEGVLTSLVNLYQENGLHTLVVGGEVTRGPAGAKRVALTFDDGPTPLYTPNILSELKRFNAHCTFFLVGRMVRQYPDLALDILAHGHELANHTYTHPNLTKLTQHEIIAEVLRTRTVMKDITGRQTHLFRPPGGNIDPFVKRQLLALDYTIVYWDINAGEYVNFAPAEQAAQIMSKVQPGSIILLHNGLVDGTLNILGPLLTALSRQGYTCVTVSELLSTSPTGVPTGKPFDPGTKIMPPGLPEASRPGSGRIGLWD